MDKKWYESKTIWSAVAFVAVAVLEFYGVPLPYVEIKTALAGLGLYGVRDALK